MKKAFIGFVVSVLIGTGSVHAQIPVTDGASLGEMIMEWVEQAMQWEQEYNQWQQSYGEAQQTRQSLTDRLQNDLTVNRRNEMEAWATTGEQVLQRIDKGFQPNSTFEDQLAATRGATRAASEQNKEQQGQLAEEASRIKKLSEQSQGAAGTLEAIQAGNQINSELVGQIQLLRAQNLVESQTRLAEQEAAQRAREDDEKLTRMIYGSKKKQP